MKCILILLNCCKSESSSPGWWLSASLVILGFILNAIWQTIIRRKEIKERINNEIFAACEKLTRIAIQTNGDSLCYDYYGMVLSKSTISKLDDPTHLPLYLKHYDFAHENMHHFNMTTVELTKNMHDLKSYDKEKAERIIKLLSENGLPVMKNYQNFFNVTKSYEELKKEFNEEFSKIRHYVTVESEGKNLIDIQKIIRSK